MRRASTSSREADERLGAASTVDDEAFRWLGLRAPDASARARPKLKYLAKLPLLSGHAVFESAYHASAEGEPTEFESKVHFQGKVPLRSYHYLLSAKIGIGPDVSGDTGADLGVEARARSALQFETYELRRNRTELRESWLETEPRVFLRNRPGKEPKSLDWRSADKPPLLAAPFLFQAFADTWDPEFRHYRAAVLAGSQPSRAQIEASRNSKEIVSLEIQVQPWDASNEASKISRLRAIYEPERRLFTRLELQLPVFGAVAFALAPDG